MNNHLKLAAKYSQRVITVIQHYKKPDIINFLCLLALMSTVLFPVASEAQQNQFTENQAPSKPEITTIKFAGDTIVITSAPIDPLPDLTAHNLLTYGSGMTITATKNSIPLAQGDPLPVSSLRMTLSYSGVSLPGSIPDESLLNIYYSSDGSNWLLCPSADCQQDKATDSFTFGVYYTGKYLIAAPYLDSSSFKVVPTQMSIASGNSYRFNATINLHNGQVYSYALPLSWSVNAAAGSIDSSGLFTSGYNLGTYSQAITARLGTWNAYADLTITSGKIYLPIILRNHTPSLRPNDPFYQTYQWNMELVRAPVAWNINTGENGAIVAILDTGVDLTHPDLVANLVQGKDFVNNDDTPNDDNGHGTHVAGIVAAVGNNATGVTGVSWNSKIMPLKILNANGVGSADNAWEAIKYAVNNGARVINMSFGMALDSPDDSPILRDAMQYAVSHGVILVAAVGNVGSNNIHMGDNVYPAAYEGVIGVGSVGSSGNISYFSNQGNFVDLVAPGESIFSTLKNSSYGYGSGTSMATPHVSGFASLLWAINPNLSRDAIVNTMLSTAKDSGATGYDPIYGYGLMDAGAAAISAQYNFTASEYTISQNNSSSTVRAQNTSDQLYRPGYVLVELKPGADLAALEEAMPSSLQTMSLQATCVSNVIRIAVPVGNEIETVKTLRALPDVAGAYLDYLLFAM